MNNIGRLAGDVNKKLDQVDRITNSAEQIAQSAERISQTAATVEAQTLPRVNALVEDAARGIRSADRLVETIGDEPASVIFGAQPPQPGPGEPGFSAAANK